MSIITCSMDDAVRRMATSLLAATDVDVVAPLADLAPDRPVHCRVKPQIVRVHANGHVTGRLKLDGKRTDDAELPLPLAARRCTPGHRAAAARGSVGIARVSKRGLVYRVEVHTPSA